MRWFGLFSHRLTRCQNERNARIVRQPGIFPVTIAPTASALSIDMQLLLAQRFMGLEDLNGAFERISRYEVALWRQVRQIVFTLSTLQRRHSGRRYRMPRDSWKSSEAFSPD